MKRYSVSGIYIFDKFPDEDRRHPTCIEDCQQETRLKWLESLDIEALRKTFNILKDKIKEIINTAFEGTDYLLDVDELLADSITKINTSENKESLIDAVDLTSIKLHDLVDCLVTDDILVKVEENDEICGDSSDLQ